MGPNLSEQGGMGSVEKMIVASATDKFEYKHLSTWNSPPQKSGKLIPFIKSSCTLLQLLLAQRVDLLHIHMSERGSVLRKLFLASLAFLFKKPVIMHAHGCEFHVFYNNLTSLQKSVIQSCLQRCTYVIALSDSWKEFYVRQCKLSPNQVVVFKNPVVFPLQLRKKNQSDVTSFLFLGKINERKGVYDLVRSIAKLNLEERSRMKLTLAGCGEIDNVKNLAKELNILETLQFTGWVDAETRDQLLADADVFVLPSYNEGLPMALLEAMSWSLPVITTPVGGIPEVISHEENGYLVNPGDIESLTAALSNFINDAELRIRLGLNAKESISDLDITAYASKLFALYSKSIGY
ncbi:glycosyltransferase family 4 protein [Nodosilinea sp. P-1105]|uniref:glycosyltransferase family 4 protein n=1 Tax=Nodosilinea sp. P-1105 TaxID=2546229 RepID=UPI00198072B9|nr:glycosyltransferase family 4 protein [Nodosilinea sp. P-1105]